MPTMITLSLLLNIAVLLPVTGSIIGNAGWVEAAYGPPSPARGILLAVYLAILAVTFALMRLYGAPAKGATPAPAE